MRPAVSLLVRAVAVLALAVVLLSASAGVASAHGAGGLAPSSSLPEIVALEPQVAGLAVTVIDAGARLRIDNGSGAPVEVVPPPGTARAGEPIVATGTSARWADRRISGAAAAGPLPGARREWTIPLQVGGRGVVVRGVQVWPEPPPALPWWVATILSAAAVSALGIAVARHRRWWTSIVLAAATLAAVAADVTHTLGSALVVDGQPYLASAVGAAGVGLAAWPIGLLGAVWVARRNPSGPVIAGVCGAYLVFTTAYDVVGFSDAVLPFGWSPDLDRATTVVTLGAGLGLLVGGFTALRRLTPALNSDFPSPPDPPTELT